MQADIQVYKDIHEQFGFDVIIHAVERIDGNKYYVETRNESFILEYRKGFPHLIKIVGGER